MELRQIALSYTRRGRPFLTLTFSENTNQGPFVLELLHNLDCIEQNRGITLDDHHPEGKLVQILLPDKGRQETIDLAAYIVSFMVGRIIDRKKIRFDQSIRYLPERAPAPRLPPSAA